MYVEMIWLGVHVMIDRVSMNNTLNMIKYYMLFLFFLYVTLFNLTKIGTSWMG